MRKAERVEGKTASGGKKEDGRTVQERSEVTQTFLSVIWLIAGLKKREHGGVPASSPA